MKAIVKFLKSIYYDDDGKCEWKDIKRDVLNGAFESSRSKRWNYSTLLLFPMPNSVILKAKNEYGEHNSDEKDEWGLTEPVNRRMNQRLQERKENVVMKLDDKWCMWVPDDSTIETAKFLLEELEKLAVDLEIDEHYTGDSHDDETHETYAKEFTDIIFDFSGSKTGSEQVELI